LILLSFLQSHEEYKGTLAGKKKISVESEMIARRGKFNFFWTYFSKIKTLSVLFIKLRESQSEENSNSLHCTHGGSVYDLHF